MRFSIVREAVREASKRSRSGEAIFRIYLNTVLSYVEIAYSKICPRMNIHSERIPERIGGQKLQHEGRFTT